MNAPPPLQFDALPQRTPHARPSVITIGNFDGVHRGHQAIIRRARALADERGAEVVALTFSPPPAVVLRPSAAPLPLTTAWEKSVLLEHSGVDRCFVVQTTQELLGMAPADFITRVVAAQRPLAFVEGPDFFYGRGRSGDIETLRAHGREAGFDVVAVAPQRVPELPELPRASSTAARARILAGAVDEAQPILGRPHRIVGAVEHGDARGAALGFPTANLRTRGHLLPALGVYAAVAQLAHAPLRLAAVNIGAQPTFDQPHVRIEAHLLDYDGDLYGQQVGLHFVRRLRGQVRFDGVAALQAQLRSDVAAVAQELAALEALRTDWILPLLD